MECGSWIGGEIRAASKTNLVNVVTDKINKDWLHNVMKRSVKCGALCSKVLKIPMWQQHDIKASMGSSCLRDPEKLRGPHLYEVTPELIGQFIGA